MVDNLFEIILYQNEDDLFLNKINSDSLKHVAQIRKAEGVYYLLDYKSKIVSKIIWSLKFRGQKRFARFFGEVLAASLEEIVSKTDGKFGDFGNFDNFLLVPIPIHRHRRVERGFNQCELICESLVENFSNRRQNFHKFYLEYRPEFLQRNKHTSKQSWKSANERQNGLRGVFEVPEKFHQQIRGRKIILVDDVVTTGSTVKEARRTLEESGAYLIISIAVAH